MALRAALLRGRGVQDSAPGRCQRLPKRCARGSVNLRPTASTYVALWQHPRGNLR